ncbi:MAG: tol-pal system protein YbgF [Burkholderiales bacterium]|nr:tol-pal system protein YbgF [Burkholderiales bacterium]
MFGAGLALAASGVQAGLFDDDEARKAILDLRSRLQSVEDNAKARVAEQASVNTQLLEQLQQLRRSLLDLNAQLEAQRGETAALRGAQEQLARQVAELQRQQKDLVQALDDRLRKLEPQKVAVDGKEFLVDADERRAHDDAMALIRAGDFDKAALALGAFARRYPASGYIDSVRFWLGNALYGKRDYKEAVANFRALVTASPDHPRAAEALLAIANCQVEMKDIKSARRTLDEVQKSYPKSEAAAAAKERLGSLKG